MSSGNVLWRKISDRDSRPKRRLLVALTVLVVPAFVGATFTVDRAYAYDCRPGMECHFVRITAQSRDVGWAANMDLMDGADGHVIYHWYENHMWGGGYASWWFQTAPGDPNHDKVHLKIWWAPTGDANHPKIDDTIEANRDICYRIFRGSGWEVTRTDLTEKCTDD